MGHCQPLLSMHMYWLASTYSATAMSTMVEAYNQHAYYMDVCSSSPSFSHYFSDTRIHHSPLICSLSQCQMGSSQAVSPAAKLDNVACGNRTRLTIAASPFATPCHSFIITEARRKNAVSQVSHLWHNTIIRRKYGRLFPTFSQHFPT